MMNTLPYKSGVDALVALSLIDKKIREDAQQKEAEERQCKRNKRIITREELLEDICNVFKQKVSDMPSLNRQQDVIRCRHIYFYIARIKLTYHLKGISEYVNRDHTTVIHAVRKISGLLEVNDESFIGYWKYYLHNSKLFTPEDFT